MIQNEQHKVLHMDRARKWLRSREKKKYLNVEAFLDLSVRCHEDIKGGNRPQEQVITYQKHFDRIIIEGKPDVLCYSELQG